jgi:hypothetical protein
MPTQSQHRPRPWAPVAPWISWSAVTCAHRLGRQRVAMLISAGGGHCE